MSVVDLGLIVAAAQATLDEATLVRDIAALRVTLSQTPDGAEGEEQVKELKVDIYDLLQQLEVVKVELVRNPLPTAVRQPVAVKSESGSASVCDEVGQRERDIVCESTPRYGRSLVKAQVYKPGDDIGIFFDKFAELVHLNRTVDSNLNLYLLSLVRCDKTYRKLKAVQLTPLQQSSADLLVQCYREALYPTSESRVLRAELKTMRQKQDESTEDFILRIYEQCTKAYIAQPELKEEAAITTLLSGMSDASVRRKLLEADVSSFVEASKLAVKCERIAEAVGENESAGDVNLPVFSVRHNTTPSDRKCYNCGRPGHMANFCQEPIKCYSCNRTGHFARDCRQSQNRPVDFNNARPNSQGRMQRQNTCFNCNQAGHFAQHCPQNQLAGAGNSTAGPKREQTNLNGSAAGRYPTHSSRMIRADVG